MTTIACDRHSMASDSARFREGTQVTFHTEKIVRLSDGSIIGATGDCFDTEAFRTWMLGGQLGQRPEANEEFTGLQIHPDGTLTVFREKGPGFAGELPASIGSGADLALGAMLAGASPEAAVAIAIERDSRSGGELRVLYLEEKKPCPSISSIAPTRGGITS